MKKINELTKKEIIELTDDDLQKMVNLELAENGIPFLDKPKEPEYEPIELPEKILYSFPEFNLYSIDESIMNEIVLIIENNRDKLRKIDYKYGHDRYDYEMRKLKTNSYDSNEIAFKVTSKTVYSEEQALKIKDIAKRNEERKKEHEELLGKWEEIQEQINEIKGKIYDTYYEVIEQQRIINTHKERFAEYILIAGGNKKSALDFYRKAYTITDEIEKELLIMK